MAKEFQYQLFKDAELTGNFEISLHKDKDLIADSFKEVHSKKKSGGFPSADWDKLSN